MSVIAAHRCTWWVNHTRGFLRPAALIHFDDIAGWWWGDDLGTALFDGDKCPYCGVVLDNLLREVAS